MKIADFSEAQAVLRTYYGNSHQPYDLTTIRALLQFVGNPQNKLQVIHVAGTSGKTSTAYYISALLESSGAKVGLTVSPHVDALNERVQLNRQPLDESTFCQTLGDFIDLVRDSGLQPSYFEIMISLAFWEFARQRVDYAVVEVGLGGLLDGTNVMTATDKVCVITDIGLDHTEILGDTLGLIAAQKAGIILPKNVVFMYPQGAEVMEAVQTIASAKDADLRVLASGQQRFASNLPSFQNRNLGLASSVADYVLVRDGKPVVSSSSVQTASEIHIPARFERIALDHKTLIIDASHNAQKLAALFESIRALYPDQKPDALVAFVSGPNSRWQEAVKIILPEVTSLLITSFNSEQDVPKHSVDPTVVATYCREHGFTDVSVIEDPKAAYQALLAAAGPLALVAGSFYLLNHIRPLVEKP